MTPGKKKNNENVEEKTKMISEEAEERLEKQEMRKCGGDNDSDLEDLDLSGEDIEELKKIFGDPDLSEAPVREIMINAYREAFDSSELRYEYKEEGGVILTGFALDCKLGDARMVIEFGDDDASIRCYAPLKATEDVRSAVMEYITRANYGLRDGAFEMNLSDGEVVYKTYVNCEDLINVPERIVLKSVYVCAKMMEIYGNGLVAIMMGFSDPATEIEKAENADD